jgi:8-amino-7-oxononanoate synthase
MTRKARLDDAMRDNLLKRVQSMREAEQAREPVIPQRKRKLSSATDFSTLPGYDEVRMQQMVAERLGIDNPYFKLHDGLAGARTSIGGRELLNFSSYDYLGLNGHPEISAAAKAAIDRFGVSCSASRVVAGQRDVHVRLEQALAKHYKSEAALLFVSGHATNVSVIGQLVGPKDLLVFDSASHNSIVVGGVLSGATRRSFAHNDLAVLDQLLAANRSKYERVLIVVEGHYSMDGDFPDLKRLVDLKQRYDAWLMVDEAHALGVLGEKGFGIAEESGVDPANVDIWMGTLSKTLVACGGYIAGSAVLIDYLRTLAHAFVYSVGLPPVIAATAEKALELLHREPERVSRLNANSKRFRERALAAGLDLGTSAGTSVAPVIIGDSIPTVLLCQRLLERGINVQPVLYPGVPPKTSRLRFFINASHSPEDIDIAVSTIAEELKTVMAMPAVIASRS